jgi:hypothetical protein
MNRIWELPSVFSRFDKMGGVLDFALFEDTDGEEADVLSAIALLIEWNGPVDVGRLRQLGSRRIGKAVFFGDWYDNETGSLLKVGDWTTIDGRELHNPRLKKLEGVHTLSGVSAMPDMGSGGQFAYAFSSPPYTLTARPREIQAVFAEIRDFILPPGERHEISDWSAPQLPEVSRYFDAGAEYWGVFLFSIFSPALRRLIVIAGSTTD